MRGYCGVKGELCIIFGIMAEDLNAKTPSIYLVEKMYKYRPVEYKAKT